MRSSGFASLNSPFKPVAVRSTNSAKFPANFSPSRRSSSFSDHNLSASQQHVGKTARSTGRCSLFALEQRACSRTYEKLRSAISRVHQALKHSIQTDVALIWTYQVLGFLGSVDFRTPLVFFVLRQSGATTG